MKYYLRIIVMSSSNSKRVYPTKLLVDNLISEKMGKHRAESQKDIDKKAIKDCEFNSLKSTAKYKKGNTPLHDNSQKNKMLANNFQLESNRANFTYDKTGMSTKKTTKNESGNKSSKNEPRAIKIPNFAINNAMCKYCHKQEAICQAGKNILYIIYEATTTKTYNANIINDIIFNVPSHIVSVFKEWLIYDEMAEFCKSFYSMKESEQQLKSSCEFYDKYSKVFPNYYVLSLKKCLFKNIEKKQKFIDEKHKDLFKKDKKDDTSNKLFTKGFIADFSISKNSILKDKDKDKINLKNPMKLTLAEVLDRYWEDTSISFLKKTIEDEFEVENNSFAKKRIEKEKERAELILATKTLYNPRNVQISLTSKTKKTITQDSKKGELKLKQYKGNYPAGNTNTNEFSSNSCAKFKTQNQNSNHHIKKTISNPISPKNNNNNNIKPFQSTTEKKNPPVNININLNVRFDNNNIKKGNNNELLKNNKIRIEKAKGHKKTESVPRSPIIDNILKTKMMGVYPKNDIQSEMRQRSISKSNSIDKRPGFNFGQTKTITQEKEKEKDKDKDKKINFHNNFVGLRPQNTLTFAKDKPRLVHEFKTNKPSNKRNEILVGFKSVDKTRPKTYKPGFK